jgi:hypothetical protein
MENHGKFTVGQSVKLGCEASWTNYGTPRKALPAGTILKLESWRPEGFTTRKENGDSFFLFEKYLVNAEIITGN